jgi:hypothetical protein
MKNTVELDDERLAGQSAKDALLGGGGVKVRSMLHSSVAQMVATMDTATTKNSTQPPTSAMQNPGRPSSNWANSTRARQSLLWESEV